MQSLGKNSERNYREAECVKFHTFFVCFVLFLPMWKSFSNFSNLTQAFLLPLISAVGSIEKWNLNLIVSLINKNFLCRFQKKSFEIQNSEPLWEILFSKGLYLLWSKQFDQHLKRKLNKVLKHSKNDFPASILFLNLKENQLVTVMISPRQRSSLFFNFHANWQVL